MTKMQNHNAVFSDRKKNSIDPMKRLTHLEVHAIVLRSQTTPFGKEMQMLEDLQGETHPTDGPIAIPRGRQDVADYLNLPSGSVRAAVDALEGRGLVKRMPPDGIAIVDRAAFTALVEGDTEDE